MDFKPNMATWDRSLRITIGIVLLVMGPITNILNLTTVVLAVLGIVGALALLSGISAYCPLYALTGSNTRNKASHD